MTGAGGTVGREVAKRLAGVAPARLGLHTPDGDSPVESVRFDFLDPASFPAALRGVDRVFLLRPPRLAWARHDFAPFVAAARAAGVARIVFLSVRGAAGNPFLPHRRIERLLERSGMAWTHLRPNDFMQNFATVHQADIRDAGAIWAPAGSGRTSFVDARDVADAAVQALTGQGHDRRTYTLTGARACDLRDVADMLTTVLGRRIVYRNPGVPAFLRHMRASGRPFAVGWVMTGVYTAARLGLAAAVTPDLPQMIGRPPTTLHRFIDDYAASWRRAA